MGALVRFLARPSCLPSHPPHDAARCKILQYKYTSRRNTRKGYNKRYMQIKIRPNTEHTLQHPSRALSNDVLVPFFLHLASQWHSILLWPIGESANPPFLSLCVSVFALQTALHSVHTVLSSFVRTTLVSVPSLQARTNHSITSRRQCTLCPSLLSSTTV